MRKRLLSLLFAATLVFALPACGETQPESSTPSIESSTPESTGSESSVSESSQVIETPTESETNQNEPGEETTQLNSPEILHGLQQSRLIGTYGERVDDQYYMLETNRIYYTLSEEDAKRYPELAKVLEEGKAQAKFSGQEGLNRLIEGFEDMKTGGNFICEMHDNDAGRVLRADTEVFSYLTTNDWYFGGAHGGYGIYGKAYDVRTGKELALSDVIKDGEKLKEYTAKRLDEDYGDIFFQDVYTTIAGYQMEQFAWSLDYFGLTLYFNQYELAPYAAGIQTVFFSYADYPELFAERFLTLPKQYVTQLDFYATYQIDVDDDGALETLELGYQAQEYDYFSDIITIDGKETSSGNWMFSADCYYVKSDQGNYLYLFAVSENDYTVLTVFDLAVGQFVTVDEENRNLYLPGWFEVDIDGDERFDCQTDCVFLNPEQFALESRLDVLSTYSGSKEYHVGLNGYPESDDTYYSVDSYFLLRTRVDVRCKLVKPDGTVIEKNAVVPAGTYFSIVMAGKDCVFGARAIGYVNSDEETYLFRAADAQSLEKDQLYYIQVDADYAWNIDGIDIFELFDGMLFAG